MILNSYADLRELAARPSARQQARPRESDLKTLLTINGVMPNPEGSHAEKCAWMKLRQMRKRADEAKRRNGCAA